MSGVNAVEFIVFTLLFVVVAVMGFMAARWKAGDTMDHLDEWGLGGRKFGGWITWFLVGGDLYTAYTFVAVPALVFGAGAIGFFALPVHGRPVPDRVPAGAAALVGVPVARLRHAGRLRPRPLLLADPGADRRDHRDRRHDAVHRAAAGRSRGGAAHHGHQRLRFRRVTCRCSSRSWCWRSTPTSPACGRRR